MRRRPAIDENAILADMRFGDRVSISEEVDAPGAPLSSLSQRGKKVSSSRVVRGTAVLADETILGERLAKAVTHFEGYLHRFSPHVGLNASKASLNPFLIPSKIVVTKLGTVVSIVASDDERRARIETGTTDAAERVHMRLRFKASHWDVVLSIIGDDGWRAMAPAELVDLITNAADGLGAPYQTEAEIAIAAEKAVALVLRKVDSLNSSGALKELNTRYKIYRQQQIAKAEKAEPYASFLHRFTASMVREVAGVAG